MVIILVFLYQNIYSLALPVVYGDNKYFFDNLFDTHYIFLYSNFSLFKVGICKIGEVENSVQDYVRFVFCNGRCPSMRAAWGLDDACAARLPSCARFDGVSGICISWRRRANFLGNGDLEAVFPC